MKYFKMNGAGNDYIFFDRVYQLVEFDPAKLAPQICDRETGIGSDGIIIIGNSYRADCSMDIYNADGSQAKMCGNGVRCVAQYFQHNYRPNAPEISVDTLSGVKKVKILENDGFNAITSVSMGRPCEPEEHFVYFDCLNERMKYYIVRTGNVHAVCFAENLVPEKFPHITEELQRRHNGNVNVEFVKREGEDVLARVFERGSGETLACGTGATAIARVLNKLDGKRESSYQIHFPGGTLGVKIDAAKCATLTGESQYMGSGELDLKKLGLSL